jgi:hypothetical protein
MPPESSRIRFINPHAFICKPKQADCVSLYILFQMMMLDFRPTVSQSRAKALEAPKIFMLFILTGKKRFLYNPRKKGLIFLPG